MTRHDVIAQALAALAAHRLRALLSSLGIVVGVATIVAALAVGEGAHRRAVEEIGSLGVENIVIRAVRSGERGRTRPPDLRLDDAAHLEASVPDAVAVASLRSAETEIRANGVHTGARMAGISLAWRDVTGIGPSAGRWFTPADMSRRHRVMILGRQLADVLYGGRNPVGERIVAAGDWYEIIGVFDASQHAAGSGRLLPRDLSRVALVPLLTMDVSLGERDAVDRVEEIIVRVRQADAVEPAAAVVRAIMRRRRPGETPTYEVVVPRELLRARLRTERTFNAVLMAVGALALLISGIGIANIMLATVAERTNEIGVRRACGARRVDILAQFASEAALLAVSGGLVGLPAGALLACAIAAIAGWPVVVSIVSVVLALALAVIVGLLAGVYPARLAAAITPCEALRAP